MTQWMDLLKSAVSASSKQQVANTLGVSRSQVSLVVNGKYIASTEHIAKKVLDVFGRIQCPHLETEITQAECQSNRRGPAPTSSAREMKHWRACQSCKQNTDNTDKGE